MMTRARAPFILHSAALLGLMAFTLDGCGSDTTTQAASTTPESRVNVSVRKIEPSQLTERISLSGQIEPWVEVRLATELGGMVETVSFDKGQRVKAGQVLAEVGSKLLAASLSGAEARLEASQAVFDKTQKLFEGKHVTRQQLIAARADLGAAKAVAEEARLRHERSIIRSPISGVAVTRDIDPGEILSPGAAITVIHRVDRLKAVVGIPESDVAAFHRGGAAAVEVDAFPDRTFQGEIGFIAPSTDGSSRTFPAEIAIPNPKGELRPGMVARVSLVKHEYSDVVVIQRDILQERDNGPVAVVLAKGDTAEVRQLALGASDDNRILVRDGLRAGEWLIVSGQRGLVSGQKLNVVERHQ